VDIETHPAMPIMVDGTPIGEGMVRIEARRRALAVMVGAPAPDETPPQQTEDAAQP
jgi:diacylglycerol kinase family enzyme